MIEFVDNEITLRQLIKIMLDKNLDEIIVITDKDGKELHDVCICSRKSQRISALFG